MKNYAGGATAERELQKGLESVYGGSLVVRSAGSHSPADLIVASNVDGTTYIVQAKKITHEKRRMTALNNARAELSTLKFHDLHCPLVAIRCRGEWCVYYLHGKEFTAQLDTKLTNSLRAAVAKIREAKKISAGQA